MNIDELTNIFSYHPPHGDQEVRYDIIRGQAKSMAIHIEKWCPRSREKSLAITKLQECVMMANAAIAIHEVKPEVAPDDDRTSGEEFPTLDTLPDPPVPVDRAGRPTVDADGDPIAVEDRVIPPEVLSEAEDDERAEIETQEENP
jgi:hypothetical protein